MIVAIEGPVSTGPSQYYSAHQGRRSVSLNTQVIGAVVVDEEDDRVEVAGFGKKLKKIGKKYTKAVKKVGKVAEKVGKRIAPLAGMAAGTMFGGPMLGQAAGGLLSNLTNRETRGAAGEAMLLAAQSGLGSLASGNADFATMLGQTLQAGLNSHDATGSIMMQPQDRTTLLPLDNGSNPFTDAFRNMFGNSSQNPNNPPAPPAAGDTSSKMMPMLIGGGLLAFLALRK